MEQAIKKVQAKLSQWHVDALWVSNPKDLYYLMHIEVSRGFLLITKDDVTLIVDGRYFENMYARFGNKVLLEKEVHWETLFTQKAIGFDADKETYSAVLKLEEKAPWVIWEPLNKPIEDIRTVKSEEEIALIETSCALCQQGFDALIGLLHEGITEQELATEIEIFWKKKGADRIAFEPIIAFGENSAYPHYRAGKARLQPGQSIMVDIGVVVNQYNSDMTRMLFFKEPPSSKMQEIVAIVVEAQERAFCACKAGLTTGELDRVAREYISEKGYGDFYVHGLGHGVGLDIHELPQLRKEIDAPPTVLEENMVITIEPGIYVPGVGGARIEDTVVVKKGHARRLITRQHAPFMVA